MIPWAISDQTSHMPHCEVPTNGQTCDVTLKSLTSLPALTANKINRLLWNCPALCILYLCQMHMGSPSQWISLAPSKMISGLTAFCPLPIDWVPIYKLSLPIPISLLKTWLDCFLIIGIAKMAYLWTSSLIETSYLCWDFGKVWLCFVGWSWRCPPPITLKWMDLVNVWTKPSTNPCTFTWITHRKVGFAPYQKFSFAIMNTVNASMGFSNFQPHISCSPHIILPIIPSTLPANLHSTCSQVEEMICHINTGFNKVQDNLTTFQAHYTNTSCGVEIVYKVSNHMMLFDAGSIGRRAKSEPQNSSHNGMGLTL